MSQKKPAPGGRAKKSIDSSIDSAREILLSVEGQHGG